MSEDELSRVWQPIQIGPMRLKNRMIVPPRVMNWSVDGVLSDRHLGHFRQLAEGGPAMIVTEQHAAYPIARGSFHNPCSAWDERAIPQFEKFAEIVHAHDVRGAVELYGTGVHDKGTMMMDDWKPLWGVSDIPSVVHEEVPSVMGPAQIATIIDGFATSATNVRAGGLDGVEIHAAHGYLLCQFMSRVYNTRTDAYGGSTANRCRIVVDIARAVREAIGQDLAVGLRMSYDEFVGATGITPDEADEQLELFASTGLFDYFSISAGSYHTIHRSVAPMHVPDGHLVPFARRAKGIVGDRAAVVTVGRVRDLHLAEDILASGSADVVAMGRAQLADPQIVRKTREGREREIIRCTGVNECVGRLFDEAEVVCMMNPVTGREHRWGSLDLIELTTRKRILVVGGGPAGLKVASVAGSRGHDVTLVESGDALGGHLNLLSSLPRQNGWAVATDDLVRAAENAGVTTRLGVHADGDFVRGFGADITYLAVGAGYDRRGLSVLRPETTEVPGVRDPHVLTIDEAIRRVLDAGGSALGDHVLIVDEAGTYPPLGLAELLAGAGTRTQVITGRMSVGKEPDRHLQLPYVMPGLHELGVVFSAQTCLDSIDGPTVTVSDRWAGRPRVIEGVSTVVLSNFRRSDTALARELADLGDRVVLIGDALAPRKLSELMYEGELVGRAV